MNSRSGKSAQALPGDRVCDRVLQRLRGSPFARGARHAVRADLVDAPVDLEVVAVGIAELDRDLAAGATPALEDDRHPTVGEPPPRAKDVLDRRDLEREVVEAHARRSLRAADQRSATSAI